MSFTTRIIFGNAISIILAMSATAILNPKGEPWAHLLIGCVVLAITSLAFWLVSGSAFKPLAGIVAALEKAADGDLSVRADIKGNGDFARLAVAFNTMMEDMNKYLRNLDLLGAFEQKGFHVQSANTALYVTDPASPNKPGEDLGDVAITLQMGDLVDVVVFVHVGEFVVVAPVAVDGAWALALAGAFGQVEVEGV